MTFKVGDKVECIDNSDYSSLLDLGRVYEVVESVGAFTTIKTDKLNYSFHHFRFKLVEEEPMKFKAGDRVVCVNNSGVSSVVKVGDCGTVDSFSESMGLLVKMDDGSLRFFDLGRFEILMEDKSYLGCINVYADRQLLGGGTFKLVSQYEKDDVVITVDNNKSTISIPEHRVRLLIKHLEEWLKNRRFDF